MATNDKLTTQATLATKEGDGYRRTTILVKDDIYRQFKAYAAINRTSVAALLNTFMEDTLKKQ